MNKPINKLIEYRRRIGPFKLREIFDNGSAICFIDQKSFNHAEQLLIRLKAVPNFVFFYKLMIE